MQSTLGKLKNATDADEKIALLEYIEDEVTQLDNARDFLTIGGMVAMIDILSDIDEHPRVLMSASWVVGTAAKNLRKIQTGAAELGIFTPLTKLLERCSTFLEAVATDATKVGGDSVDGDDAVETILDLLKKVMYAVSALCRGNPKTQHIFSSL